MSLYLKKFSTHAEYDAYINGSGAILPNVSICTTEGDVHYNPYIDPCQQYDFVEIGSVKWATKNVGACDVTDYGLLFQWGDTQGYTASQVGSGDGKKYFGWADYKYCSGAGTSSSAMTKYNKTDGKAVLDIDDDAVRVNWGGEWRMPTTAEFQALGAATTSAWTSDYEGSGVAGLVLTSKADSSKVLFFPANGICYDGSVYDSVGSLGAYWSSSLETSDVPYAYGMSPNSGNVTWKRSHFRYFGKAVRGVIG